MGVKKFTFNPFIGNFDEIEEDIVVVASEPMHGVPGVLYYYDGEPTKYWYFDGSGNRYYITGTLDNPTGGLIPFWFTIVPQ